MATVKGQITSIERLANSRSGNPRYEISVTTDGGIVTLKTSSDISDAYVVGNPGYRVGCEVEFRLSNTGRIDRMNAVS